MDHRLVRYTPAICNLLEPIRPIQIPNDQEHHVTIRQLDTRFDHYLTATRRWLELLDDQLGTEDPDRAYQVLRAVLHVLRDRLPVAEAVQLGAELPLILRGMYYEGWVPARVPSRIKRVEEFLDVIGKALPPSVVIPAQECATAVFRLLDSCISQGEMADVRHLLPKGLRALMA